MMASVSMLARSSGRATPETCSNFCIARLPFAVIDDAARHRGGGGAGGTGQVRARARPLAPLEVAAGGGAAALPRRHLVGVHAHAPGAARLAPLEAALGAAPVQPQ